MLQAKLHLTTISEGRQFVGQSGSGHQIVMDDEEGNTGAKPIELALLALGGCTGFDVITILRKMRQRVVAYDIELQAEQCSEPPRVFTHVIIKHKLSGCIKPEAVQKAIHLSEHKYCSVSAMISKTAKIEMTFEITPEDTVEASVEESAINR